MANSIQILRRGITDNNPVLIQALGMCPALATTTSAIYGLGMGVATMSVLVMSNIVISMIRKMVPAKIRIPIFIIIIAGFVTMIDLLMHGFTYELWKTLGIFIPLIVVNCVILGRAEAFASKNSIIPSILDGLGIGIGFLLVLTALGAVREVFGSGTVFGVTLWGDAFNVFVIILPPGAFITLGLMAGLLNWISISRQEAAKAKEKTKKEPITKKEGQS